MQATDRYVCVVDTYALYLALRVQYTLGYLNPLFSGNYESVRISE